MSNPTSIKFSRTLAQAHGLESVVSMINRGGSCESMEGVEFTPEDLAGQYAAEAARDNGFLDVEYLAAHLQFLSDAGAVFYAPSALEWARTVATARHENDLEQGGRHE